MVHILANIFIYNYLTSLSSYCISIIFALNCSWTKYYMLPFLREIAWRFLNGYQVTRGTFVYLQGCCLNDYYRPITDHGAQPKRDHVETTRSVGKRPMTSRKSQWNANLSIISISHPPASPLFQPSYVHYIGDITDPCHDPQVSFMCIAVIREYSKG